MQKKIGIITVIFSTCLFSQHTLALESSQESLKWVCEKPGLACDGTHDECNLYTTSNNKRIVLTTLSRDLMCRSSIYPHSKDLSEVRINCGTYCATSIFYQFSTKQLSSAFNNVLGVNPKNNVAIMIDLDGVKSISIFEKEKSLLISERELSQNSAIPAEAINSVKFKGNQVYIDYLDKNEKDQTNVFTLK